MTPPRILMVLTSHDQLGDTGKKTGFWLEEFTTPYYVFVDAGSQITLASIQGGAPPIDPKSYLPESETDTTRRFQADVEGKQRLQNTLPVESLQAEDYDAIFLPGGHGTMWDFPTSTALTHLLETFNAQNKIIAAVCHAPAAFIPVKGTTGTPLVEGKQVTSFTDAEEFAVGLENVVPFLLETRLRELGAHFEGRDPFQPFRVEDGNLITGQNPASSGIAAEAVLQALAREIEAGV